jgi:hypothetical protein
MTTIEDYVARLRRLELFDDELAELAAPALEHAARANVAAGLDPNGRPWRAKKDGSRPLVNAAAAVTCHAEGNLAVLEVSGPEYWHQTIAGDGAHPRRALIPSPGDAVPGYLAAALDDVVAKALAAGSL